MCNKKFGVCFIIPPHLLENIVVNGNETQRRMAFDSLNFSAQTRGEREALDSVVMTLTLSPGKKSRSVYDAQKTAFLPGKLVRDEGASKSKDIAVNEAYDGSGTTYDFFKKIYGRNSIDDNGLRMDSSVHYRVGFNNAFWNGQQMVYGDGDGKIFERFTKSLDVIGHELSHGVIQYEADLIYQNQSGALNEHFADVFGSLIKQYKKKQTAAKADWLIGAELLGKTINGVALRSMKDPGTAYDDPLLGKDPQPAHMKDYFKTTQDNGGVHINSGIPNKAFYELAISLGGKAWDKAGKIWYVTLCEKLKSDSQFQDCAEQTFEVAGQLYGSGSTEQKAVKSAWGKVGITV